jgi:hypothetical protein
MVRVFLLAIAFGAGQCVAVETSARTYAVLSLVGDRFMVGEPDTGHNPPQVPFFEFPTGTVDSAAALAVEDALREADSGSKTVLLRARGADFFKLQAAVMDEGGGALDLYRSLRPRLGELPATHLILVGKLRRVPNFRGTFKCWSGATRCAGRLEGLGLYVARNVEMLAPSGETVYAFVAPFAYVRLSLFDLQSGQLMAEEFLTETQIFPAPSDKDPNDVLTEQAKLDEMKRVLLSGLESAIPRLTKKR